MKNLIDEIEKIIEDLKIERQKCFEEIDYPLSQVDKLEGRILAYTDIVMALNQYNIITAPKSIKLSEIVERLSNELKDYLFEYDNNFINKKIPVIAIWNKSKKYCFAVITIENNKLILKYEEDFDYPKWLYTLWIAGTEIVDDLECDE